MTVPLANNEGQLRKQRTTRDTTVWLQSPKNRIDCVYTSELVVESLKFTRPPRRRHRGAITYALAECHRSPQMLLRLLKFLMTLVKTLRFPRSDAAPVLWKPFGPLENFVSQLHGSYRLHTMTNFIDPFS